jgi:hypothetical protein
VHFIYSGTYGADIALAIAAVELVRHAVDDSECNSVTTIGDDNSLPFLKTGAHLNAPA